MVPTRRPAADATWPLPPTTPQAAGFSARGLGRLHAALDALIDRGAYSGYVLLLARDGRVADWRAHGYRDVAAGTALAPDDVFRIFSMTKIVTSVAALTLLEDGKLALEDPLERHLPELRGARVLAGGTADAPVLVDAVRPPTVRDLLTHTSGLTYDDNAPPALLPPWRAPASGRRTTRTTSSRGWPRSRSPTSRGPPSTTASAPTSSRPSSSASPGSTGRRSSS